MNPQINTIDFNEQPFIAIWEVTQACDLACVHCRASAQPDRDPMELSTDEGKRLIDQIAVLKVPVFVLTGGDPSLVILGKRLINYQGLISGIPVCSDRSSQEEGPSHDPEIKNQA